MPVEAPKDLIDAYLEVKSKALEIVAHIFYSSMRKVRFQLRAEERRSIRNQLLENWP